MVDHTAVAASKAVARRNRNYLILHLSRCYGRSMTLDNFIHGFEHASARAETMLLAEGTVSPLFTIVDRQGHARPVAADFTSEAAKEASFAIVRMMCVAEAATAIFHYSEAWAVSADAVSGVSSLEGEQGTEVLLVAGTVRVGSRLTQKLRVREIERGPSGSISGLRDLPVSALGGVDIQHLPLQGRLMELLPAKPSTFVDRWRARGNVAHVMKQLARGQSAVAR